jgi:hypothetical protein
VGSVCCNTAGEPKSYNKKKIFFIRLNRADELLGKGLPEELAAFIDIIDTFRAIGSFDTGFASGVSRCEHSCQNNDGYYQ